MEGTFRAHQVPLAEVRANPEHLRQPEEWMKSYRPEELFDSNGAPVAELAELAPISDRRMGAKPHANGRLVLQDLVLPEFENYAVDVPAPGSVTAASTRIVGGYLRDVMKLNAETRNFQVVGPDETAPNRLGSLFDVTDRMWAAEKLPTDDHISPDGRVMDVLSEHMCQGWLEGYLLTGRHGLFSSNLHARGYKEEGTTTTPFDMTVLNNLDRFHLAGDVVDRVPRMRSIGVTGLRLGAAVPVRPKCRCRNRSTPV